VQKLSAARARRLDAQLSQRLRLSGPQEGNKVGQVHTMLAVIVTGIAGQIARLVDQRADDQRFQALFCGVGRMHPQ
jgi:hypothetical protein